MTKRALSKRALYLGLLGVVLAAVAAAWPGGVSAGQLTGDAVSIDTDDLGGIVRGPRGPEAGVWVIAETRDLPTKFSKIVVTDDAGRYVVPDLPKGTYDVWVRGYGLVDSPKVQGTPGTRLNLTAVPAPSPRAAAEYYPAGYWYGLLEIPPKSEFPGTGPAGNGIAPTVTSQAAWVSTVKSLNCGSCHQLGTKGTREIPKSLGTFDSSVAAWERRIRSGQAGDFMNNSFNALGRRAALAMFADWTDRIAAGEYPQQAPARPQGLERNVVITQWDWADPRAYLHDLVSTDRRNPRVNANGPVYGSLEQAADYVPVLDPASHTASKVPLTVRDPNTPFAGQRKVTEPSPYWGEEVIWNSRNNAHNPMMDHQGRLWLTSTVRPAPNPDFCKEGSSHPSAKLFPMANAARHLQRYDPKTKQLTHISTCFGTHHLMFAEDANHTLWVSPGGSQGPVIGWLNTRMFDETGDEARSQGWTALILDTNGNGRRDASVEPDQPVDPAKDKRIIAGFYGVSPAPDGSVWGSVNSFPGGVVRLNPGANPPATALAEYYEVPWNNPKAAVPQAFTPRGFDVDRNGVAWLALASGHLASFDRRKCMGPLNGPTATGQHCPEGWAFYIEPLPQMKGVTDPGSAGASYFVWVDWFDTFGLGRNVPISTGNAVEGLLALKDGKWINLRVPYPMGYFTKWMDARIDDPNRGWKGKGLWTTIGTRTVFHNEGGTAATSRVVKFQLRPDSLAR